MAFVVEDGTGLANANSFISVATADTLLEDSPFREAWKCKSERQREISLRFSTAYLSTKYRWFGNVFNPGTQVLAWPRTKQIDEFGQILVAGGVPIQIQKATAFLALELARAESISGGAEELQSAIDSTGEIKSFQIETLAITFDTGSFAESNLRQFLGKRFPEIELLVASMGELKGQSHLTEGLQR